VDAAREVARAAARGDSTAEAIGRGRRVAPPGSIVDLSRGGGEVTASVEAEVSGPGGLFGFLPAVRVHAEAVAADEEVG
jgi:hypothetical protein